ncbi:MAG: hypothetical protein JNJ59_02925 [Deltaproteobacteria bacterium]|nr:hypothetical protein [Deltaproteobacteria bacterium]
MTRLLSVGLAALIALLATAARANQTPNALLLSGTTLAENQPAGSEVGELSTLDSDAGDAFTYALIDNPLDAFALVTSGSPARTRLITRYPFDFETQPQYSVRIRTTDLGGSYLERTFTISVLDRNDPPTGVSLSASGLPEDTGLFGLVGTVAQLGDPDRNDAWVYTLVDDGGGRFTLEGSQLRTTSLLDFETVPSVVIVVTATDRAGASATAAIPIAIWDRNEPPLAVALTADPVPENAALGAIVGTLRAEGDPDRGDTHRFSFVGDAGPFLIDADRIRVAGTLDFETKPTWTVRVRATDRAGLSVDNFVTLLVTDVNEAPTGVVLSTNGLAENTAPGTLVGSLAALDPDRATGHTFEVVGGTPGFAVVGDALIANQRFDFETLAAATLLVRVTDPGGLEKVATLIVPILDRNEAPTGLTVSAHTVSENAPTSAFIAFLTPTDPDSGDTHELVLTADGGGAFKIDNNRILRVAGPIDFERTPTLEVMIRVIDKAGLFLDVTFVITVLDVDEGASNIAISPSGVRENQPAGTVVGQLIPLGDPDDVSGYAWQLVENPAGAFALDGDHLVTTRPLDYEATRSITVRVRAIPPGATAIEKQLVVDLIDEPEAPTRVTVSATVVQEAKSVGTAVATLSASGDPDANDTATFQLVDDPFDGFYIQGSTLYTAKVLDYEARALYPVVIRATDRAGLYVEDAFEIRVLDINEGPFAVSLTHREVFENAGPNAPIGTLAPVGDPDFDEHPTFQLVTNPEDRFDLVGDLLVARKSFDFERDPTSYRITVRVRDQGNLSAETSFFIDVLDVNEAPSAIDLAGGTFDENAPVGTVAGQITGGVDPDAGDLATFSIEPGSSDGFAVDASRRLVTTRRFDHESEPAPAVTVRLTDGAGHAVERTFVLSVADQPEPPTGVALSTTEVAEDAAIGFAIGTLSAVGDPDREDTHTFTIAADPEALFAIEDDALVLAGPLDFEVGKSHEVWITVTDSAGLAATARLVITVVDANDAPVAAVSELALEPIQEDDKTPTGITIAELISALDIVDADGDAIALKVIDARPTVAPTPETPTLGTWVAGVVPTEGTAELMALAADRVLEPEETLRFVPDLDQSGVARLVVAPWDGVSAGPEVVITIEVAAVNDAPRHLFPEAWLAAGKTISMPQQTQIELATAMGGPVQVTDVDATSLDVTLTATAGVIVIPTVAVTVLEGRVGTESVTLRGTLGALNAALSSLAFEAAEGFIGTATLTITSDDRGATGLGGARTTSDLIAIAVAPAPDLEIDLHIGSGETLVVHAGDEVDLSELGTLGAGSLTHLSVDIVNRGARELVLGPELLELAPEPGISAWVVVAPPARIAPGATASAVVSLLPAGIGPVRVGLALDSNDPDPARFEATLTGRALRVPDLVVTQGTRPVESGLEQVVADLRPGATGRVELTLSNRGAARLDLGAVEVVLTRNCEVTLEEPFPLIDAGASDTLGIFLTPQVAGRVEVVIDLPTNDPDEGTYRVHLVAGVITTPITRLVIERIPGVLAAPGSIDDLGFGRAGEDTALTYRVINLGGRELKGAGVTVTRAENAVARAVADLPATLLAGASAAMNVTVRPITAGPFEVDVQAGDALWTLHGLALDAVEMVPPEAVRLYRWGAGRVEVEDLLGAVSVGARKVAGWSIVNDGPLAIDLTLPVEISGLVNLEAFPRRQPDLRIPAHRAVLIPVEVRAPRPGLLAFDLLTKVMPALHVKSGGQVGALSIEAPDGQGALPDAVLTLPLQKVGTPAELTFRAINAGTGALVIGTPTLEGATPCKTVEGLSAKLIAAGESVPFTVVMEPIVGTFSCTLVVPSDDPARPEYRVTLVARGTSAGSDGCSTGERSSVYALALALGLLMLRCRRWPAS